MGQLTREPIQQRLQARITGCSQPTYWYSNMIGRKFEVYRNPVDLKLIESEAEKVRTELNDNEDTAYYIFDGDCRIIRLAEKGAEG